MEKKNFTFLIDVPRELIKQIDSKARDYSLSRAAFVRLVLTQAIREMEANNYLIQKSRDTESAKERTKFVNKLIDEESKNGKIKGSEVTLSDVSLPLSVYKRLLELRGLFASGSVRALLIALILDECNKYGIKKGD